MKIKIRTFTCWENGKTYNVSNYTASKYLLDDKTGLPRTTACFQLDEAIVCYVNDKDFDTLDDESLEALVNAECYDIHEKPSTII